LHTQGTERIRDFITSRREFDDIDDLLDHAVAFAPGRRRELLVNSLRHNVRRLPNGHYTWKYDLAPFGPVQPSREDALWQAAEQVACPVLVIRGEHSRVFQQEAAEHFTDRLRNGRLQVIEDSGHTVQGDNPRALADAIANFASANAGLEAG
jgi:esterase